ncbi:MAG: hypothetical protein H0V45_05090 [Actinobacteria bacterium]|nr:hypothetical protein [Actinomycetota bacterium]
MPPGLLRVGIAALGAAVLAAGAVIAFRQLVVGLLFALGGLALLAWTIKRP